MLCSFSFVVHLADIFANGVTALQTAVENTRHLQLMNTHKSFYDMVREHNKNNSEIVLQCSLNYNVVKISFDGQQKLSF